MLSIRVVLSSLSVKGVMVLSFRRKLILHLDVGVVRLTKVRSVCSRPRATLAQSRSCLNTLAEVLLVSMLLLIHDLTWEDRSGLAEASLLLMLIILLLLVTPDSWIRTRIVDVVNVLLSNLLDILRVGILLSHLISFFAVDISPREFELSTLFIFLRDKPLIRSGISIVENITLVLTSSRVF